MSKRWAVEVDEWGNIFFMGTELIAFTPCTEDIKWTTAPGNIDGSLPEVLTALEAEKTDDA